MENRHRKMKNSLGKNGKSARYKWKIRSENTENRLGKKGKSAQ
jgi:hypothetical protein